MSQPRTNAKRILAYSLRLSLAFSGPLYAQLTDIHNEPLAQPASSVKPNVTLILDDSGSMEQQYTPDYLGRRFGGSNPLCFDAGDDSSGTINTALDNCEPGDPPLMTPEVNTQYYNPEIRYFPAVNFDGTSKPSMSSANTTGWTAVPTDGVSPATVTTYQNDTLDMVVNTGTTVATANLAAGYPDRVWCNSQAASATDPAVCKTNSAYSYPDWAFPYGRTSTGALKFKTGAPYYYRLITTEHCTDLTLTNCTASTVPTGSFTVPAPVRYCTDSTLTNCQAKRQGTYTYPKFVGNVNTGSGNPGSVATASITVSDPQKDSAGGTITGIFVNGVNIISGNISLAAGFTAATAAASVSSAINCAVTSPEYHATVSSNVVTLRYGSSPSGCVTNATAAGTLSAEPNGYTVQVNFNVTSTTPATTTSSISGASNNDSISTFSVSGTNLISSSIVCSSCGGNNTQRNSYMASQLASRINNDGSGYTATSSGNDVIITAPAGTGSTLNGVTPSESSPGMGVSVAAFSGGITAGDVNLVTTNFSGGADFVPASQPARQNVGSFSRVNIVPFQDPPTNTIPSIFTKFPARTDCAGSSCTYDEEMTNFANWYAYYRSRMQMAKTAIGRAFNGITDAFRVGFITINPSADLANRFLAVNDFGNAAGGQKDLWYQSLYKQSSHGSTPLREALSRVGRYYAGVTGGINTGMPPSPIQVACQPSFSILTTDGYWNGNAGVKLDGLGIGNQDNANSGYSLRTEARYDGGLVGSTDTLADVALYYYKTDLRTDLGDQVPSSSREPNAPHQHMTTFTVGMGLAGQLTFHSNYESGASPDFERLKIDPASGGLNWPVPAANTETALDDLWHAAVNGRGTFFSAKDPSELANGISETLNSVSARIGAGAAAATSNLQPIAGDNFAFTAQYETVTWIGDVKARTIDLSSGAVASRELWSAGALLNERNHTTRRLYTFDSTDTTADALATPPTNGNRLKSFCWPGAIGLVGYPTCTDGTGLSAAEMDYFLPLTTSPAPSNEPALVQSPPWLTDGSGRDVSATKEKLLDYIRGDVSNETTGGTAVSDLFRDRVSLLGDIINAQPAYVKASPFGYNTGSSVGMDPFYTEFKNTTNGVVGTRKGTVYVAANDGMLHAFETDPDNNPYFQTAGISTAVTSDDTFTGTLNTSPTSGEGSERWAYVPGSVLPHLKRLADAPYMHRFYTDGSPVVGDVCFGHTTTAPCSSQSSWHTVLVAGLNAGGRGYYALDVTDPDNPKAMWEVKGGTGALCLSDADANSGTFGEDCNIGFTYGNPLIIKRKSDGKWVVVVTSGYNNVNPGDGKGYLYILDAQTGLILQRLSTGVGCDGVNTTSPCVAGTADPSGLGRINAWVDDAFVNNTALTVYGGDLKGNVWRFQLDNTVAAVPLNSTTRIATLTSDGTNPQPVTTKPELGLVSGKRVVFIATGKFLGLSDKSTIQRQSVYAIKDEMNSTISPTVAMTRSGSFPTSTISGFVRQDLIASPTSPTTERTTTSNPVDFTDPSVAGWFIDLPDGGSGGNGSERANVDPVVQFGTLVVPSNVPSTDSCSAGGFGWLNFLDYKSGAFVPGALADMASMKITSSLVVGINVVQLPGGTVKTIVTTADNQQLTRETPVAPSNFAGRRVSWRELFFE
jgi:type IV pilus assembly protein PilY1